MIVMNEQEITYWQRIKQSVTLYGHIGGLREQLKGCYMIPRYTNALGEHAIKLNQEIKDAEARYNKIRPWFMRKL